MATTSITSSTQSPYSGLLLQDVNYTTTFQLTGSAGTVIASPSFYFPGLNYPEVGHLIVQLSNTTVYNTTSSFTYSASLQHSANNSTWVNIPQLNASLLTFTDVGSTGVNGGTGSAGSVQALLPPNTNQYVRAVFGIPSAGVFTGGLTGSITYTILF